MSLATVSAAHHCQESLRSLVCSLPSVTSMPEAKIPLDHLADDVSPPEPVRQQLSRSTSTSSIYIDAEEEHTRETSDVELTRPRAKQHRPSGTSRSERKTPHKEWGSVARVTVSIAIATLVLGIAFGIGSVYGQRKATSLAIQGSLYANQSYQLALYDTCADHEVIQNTTACRRVLSEGPSTWKKRKRLAERDTVAQPPLAVTTSVAPVHLRPVSADGNQHITNSRPVQQALKNDHEPEIESPRFISMRATFLARLIVAASSTFLSMEGMTWLFGDRVCATDWYEDLVMNIPAIRWQSMPLPSRSHISFQPTRFLRVGTATMFLIFGSLSIVASGAAPANQLDRSSPYPLEDCGLLLQMPRHYILGFLYPIVDHFQCPSTSREEHGIRVPVVLLYCYAYWECLDIYRWSADSPKAPSAKLQTLNHLPTILVIGAYLKNLWDGAFL